MCCCAEGVTHHQEADVDLWCFGYSFEEVIDFNFAEVPVGLDELPAEELAEFLSVDSHDGGVVFEVDLLGGFDGIKPSDGDVLGRAKSESNNVEDHLS